MSPNSPRHVCQDHFDLEEDTINLMRYRLQNTVLNLKPGILPHKFECQKRANPEEKLVQKKDTKKKSQSKKTSKPEKKFKSPRKKV
ncbi:hypothetical protein JTE90_027236 [Oedothorax gibbosus]|uniref:THAP-type domain-containing protein n=1 Tax=Oedothorax gibbosus TaxID=931172 RepID=A0AAV6U3F7_9ARAC|nr:hypothetical protein JTE90_027236 [Oedothorax gibbosus]